VPKASDTLSQSQPPFLVNFGQLDTIFSLDHIEYAAATVASRGRHKKITFNDAASDPNLAKPISALYTKGAVGGPMEMFFQNDTLATNIVKLTGSIIADSGNDSHGGTYVMFQTPWGLKIWTGGLAAFAGSQNYTLSGAVSFGATIYTAQSTPYGGGPKYMSFNPNGGTKTFNAQTTATGGGQPAFWFAITN
jgi:hypothetical protein